MPWSPKQLKAIRAKKHGWNPPGGDEPFANVSKGKLSKMEHEGIKTEKAEHPVKKSKKKRPTLAAQLKGLK